MSLNADQVFIIQSVTRKEIAETLNELIEQEDSDVEPFAEDDARLTDEVCEAVAGASMEANSTVDEVYEKESEFIKNVFETYFGDE